MSRPSPWRSRTSARSTRRRCATPSPRSSFDSLYAHIKYGENGQIVLPQIVIQIQEDKVVPIYTADFLNKPEYPVPAWGDRK